MYLFSYSHPCYLPYIYQVCICSPHILIPAIYPTYIRYVSVPLIFASLLSTLHTSGMYLFSYSHPCYLPYIHQVCICSHILIPAIYPTYIRYVSVLIFSSLLFTLHTSGMYLFSYSHPCYLPYIHKVYICSHILIPAIYPTYIRYISVLIFSSLLSTLHT